MPSRCLLWENFGDGTKAMAESDSLPVTAHNVIVWKRCRGWGLSVKHDTEEWQELKE